ncbi:hypothetical protein BEWA_025730 [Theileria equi strain WA]|uniref:XPG N-terminal domain-containing protein n=1 Tax=Theileria equi strain WA TaxID=1537102 RepID=L0AXT5_THEEQ|nr:hypothetical protein BEWA_025730 [Theileria equi strain WA]AFZ79724.1 hypothetical protein BEWA_025730 [Theileria equi strain WA]|eukprot:XP_004829390.1 hypothetical protein BEWA_025730 [Theileria equi strain WA]
MNRCVHILEAGIKPLLVFDSTPPNLKLDTLSKRKEKHPLGKPRRQVIVKYCLRITAITVSITSPVIIFVPMHYPSHA